MILPYNSIAEELSELIVRSSDGAVPIRAIKSANFLENSDAGLSAAQAAWLRATGWQAKPGSHVLLPGDNGLEQVLLAIEEGNGDAGGPSRHEVSLLR